MRIAYLLKKFPRLSETFVLTEMLGQEALGARLHVFSRRTPDDEPRHAELARLRAPVEVLPGGGRIDAWAELFASGANPGKLLECARRAHERYAQLGLEKFGALLGEALWLLRRTRELEIEHVHAHFATDSALVAMLLRELGGPPFSLTAHAKDIYRTSVDFGRLSELIGASAFTVTVCDANVDFLRARLAPRAAQRVRRLYNGIDIESFAAPRTEPRQARHVLSVGRLVEKKGFGILLDALELLVQRGVEFQATLVGDGEDRARLEARVRGGALAPRVQLTGAQTQAQVREHFARASLFALPCRIGDDGNRDALPTVLLEAQAAGVACVSTPVGGVAEILDAGRAGALAPVDDPRALAAKLEHLLDDAGECERLAAEASRVVRERFDVRRQSRVLNSWFEASVAAERERCASRS